MARLRRLWLQLTHAFRPSRGDAEATREIASHLALLEDEYRRRGMSPEDARTEARKALGGVEQVRLAHRDTRGFRWLDELRVDVRYALRGQRWQRLSVVCSAGGLILAGAALSRQPWRSADGYAGHSASVQLLALISLAVLAASVVAVPERAQGPRND